jgi:hypothetical protein
MARLKFCRLFKEITRKGVMQCVSLKFIGIKRIVSNRVRLYTLGVIITGILSLLVSVVTFYGENTGNFVISIDDVAAVRGIEIADNPRFEFAEQHCLQIQCRDALDITYAWIGLRRY